MEFLCSTYTTIQSLNDEATEAAEEAVLLRGDRLFTNICQWRYTITKLPS